tara:strand:- start:372 stop:767 length:396 start_codon:yes stop_codon:yes gene_type:complete
MARSENEMTHPYQPPSRSWVRKFQDALRGWKVAVLGQSSFLIHGIASLLVVILAYLLEMSPSQWFILILCMGTVLTAELFNSALEQLAQAVDNQYNEHVRAALDISAGAVLMAALAASLVGGILFLTHWLN